MRNLEFDPSAFEDLACLSGPDEDKPSAGKAPLPKFRSDDAAGGYSQTHPAAEVRGQLRKANPARQSKALANSIRERPKAAKSPISIRLGPKQIAAAKKIATATSVGYQTQLRMWIAEGIRREAKLA